ncbi:MAG: hypothetical protein O2887_18880 [Bacteroidetes bacterium]|nr:hypothetical protein [Bacteroidota bacterium]
MTLKDTFDKLLSQSPYGRRGLCKMGRIYVDFDEETQKSFKEVMLSGAATTAITKALNQDGIGIRREFVAIKRKCFTQPGQECCLWTTPESALGSEQ